MAARSKENAVEAIAELKQATGKEAIFLELDLSNLKQVRKAAEEFMRSVLLPTNSKSSTSEIFCFL
jgi:NAD(P)-dependent dehydrogenase (short-subunit alcohol dehydrogenase family)